MTRDLLSTTALCRTLFLATAVFAGAALPAAAAPVGVTSATDGDPLGKPPTDAERILRIGIDVQANELITTKANDRAHLVFLDGSSLTVGPNAQLTIDKFVFDPDTKKGELVINASKGVFRLVGGKISKTTAININTPSSTIGIRGGITIFKVTDKETDSSFIFGISMLVSSHGKSENVTRPGSQVITFFGNAPGMPTLLPPGGLTNILAQLEGATNNSNNNQGNNNNKKGNADKGAQTFGNSNSGQGPQNPNVNYNFTAPNLNSNVLVNAVNNNNPATNPSNTTAQPTTTTNPPPPPTPPPPKPTVIVTQGRYLADPIFDSQKFNPHTLAVPHIHQNDQPLMPTGTVLNGVATITTQDGRKLNVPWIPGTLFDFTGSAGSGIANAIGLVSPTGNFFAYIFTRPNGKKFGFVGGTQAAKSDFPTSGIGQQQVVNLGGLGNLPFANDQVGGNAALKDAASVSNLYSAYSKRLGPGSLPHVPIGQAAVSLQVTVAIAGEGASQTSYMGAYIGSYYTDAKSNTIAGSGQYTGTYRLDSSQGVGRLTSYESTASTGNGNAIYGPNDYALYVPDKLTTTKTHGHGHGDSEGSNGGGSTVLTTTRTPSASLDQGPGQSRGSPYYQPTLAVPSTTPSSTVGQERTTQTMNGYVGGIIQSSNGEGTSSRLLNVGVSNPNDVSISTNASTNTAQATIILRNFGGNTGEDNGHGSSTAVFQLGGISHQNGVPNGSSAFIDNNIYGMRDQTGDKSRRSHVAADDSSNIKIKSNTVLTSYNAAPLPNNKLPGGVTPCVCAFMSWGWWSGGVSYGNHGGFRPGQTDTLNLATYVVGTLTNRVQMPRMGTATYSGSAIANVVNGGKSYVAAGGFNQSWDFNTQRGNAAINLDGATYTGNTALQAGTVNFNGPLAGAGRTGSLNGSFFSSPTNPVAGQGGNFNVNGSGYKAGGTFAAQKQ